MCGFAGFLDDIARPREAHALILHAMSRRIAHRGPDDEQFLQTEGLNLVFRRLSIVDLAGGRQPIANEDGSLWIAANAEIYNHEELRKSLSAPHVFRTRSDVEVVLHLYEEIGCDVFERLAGKFAIAIWDARTRKLVLGRDPLGVKPLYYHAGDGLFIFGSELKAVLAHPRCPREVDWDGYEQREPERIPSYVRDVSVLSGGHHAVVTADGRPRISRFWSVDRFFGTGPSYDDPSRYVSDYRDLFEESVRRRLMSDVPIGAFLSGGIDSAAVVSAATRLGHRPRCYTILERSTALCGDAAAAERLSESLGCPIDLVVFDHRNLGDELGIDLGTLEYYVWLLDSPRFTLEFLLKHELHRFVKTSAPETKVILLGQGADEFAGGYSYVAGRSRHGGWDDYIANEILDHWRHTIGPRTSLPRNVRGLVANRYYEQHDGRGWSHFHRAMLRSHYALQFYNLWHEDRTAAAQGIEARVPFLDRGLVEYLAGIPERHHAQLFWNKRIVREMAAGFVPDWMPGRPKVPLFGVEDRASVRALYLDIVRRVYPGFRRKYLERHDTLFDTGRMDGLMRACSGGERSDDAVQLLIQCMAMAIFQRLAQHPAAHDEIVRATQPSPLRSVTSVSAGPRWPTRASFVSRFLSGWRPASGAAPAVGST